MAKISDSEAILPGGIKWRKVIQVSSKGIFSVDLPDALSKIDGVKTLTNVSLQGLEKALADLIAKFRGANTTVRRVIAYTFASGGAIYRHQDGARRIIHKGEKLPFFQGLALDLCVAVYDEFLTEIDGKRNLRYERVESTIPLSVSPSQRVRLQAETTIIDWSQEQEDWFARLVVGFENLVLTCTELNQKSKLEAFRLNGSTPALLHA